MDGMPFSSCDITSLLYLGHGFDPKRSESHSCFAIWLFRYIQAMGLTQNGQNVLHVLQYDYFVISRLWVCPKMVRMSFSFCNMTIFATSRPWV